MSLSLFLDGLIVVLLAVTIFYGVVLSRRLAMLRQGEGEMRAKLDEFSAAAARAEASFAKLKGSAPGAETDGPTTLDSATLEKAELLRDDLVFLIERGEALAGRLKTTATRRAPGTPAKGETASPRTLGRALMRAAKGSEQGGAADEDSTAENAGIRLLRQLGHARADG